MSRRSKYTPDPQPKRRRTLLSKHPPFKVLELVIPEAPLPKLDEARLVLPVLAQDTTPSLPLREMPRPIGPRSEDYCLSPEEQYVAFAALATMIDDAHAVQDQMSDGQWTLAESLYRRLTAMVERREKAK